jgi:hypothetical protein
VYHAENISKVAVLCPYGEYVSGDIISVQLQSLSTSFVFRIGIMGILKEVFLVTGNLQSNKSNEGSQ